MEFLIRGMEKIPCPCCGKGMRVIGTRDRKSRDRSGKMKTLNIRRLRCDDCGRIHHELPDFIVPYKRYESECIELVLTNPSNNDVPADESTLSRWANWFNCFLDYWIGCLNSIMLRTKQEKDPLNRPSLISKTVPQKIGRLVGDAPRWLERIVRPIVNFNLWIHTRSAFLSG
jgi:hypothetical protein